MQKNAWKVGELARQTGITVRTLHHYHQVGLLSPSEYTESGHRLYTRSDISRLQQIISLKQLGFSLEDIKEFIDKPNYDPLLVIQTQLEKVNEQIRLQEHLRWELEHIYKLLGNKEEIGAEDFIKLIEVIRMNGQNYMTQEQIEKMKKLQESITDEDRSKMETEWRNFISKLQTNYNSNAPVDNPEVLELARFWRNLASRVTGNDAEIAKAAQRFHTENPNNPLQFGMTAELYKYLMSAIVKL